MVKVIWTKRAFGQLKRVIRYTKEEQGLSYAEAVLNRILKSSELLKSMPKIVRVEPLLGVCRTFNNSESKKMGFSEPIIGF